MTTDEAASGSDDLPSGEIPQQYADEMLQVKASLNRRERVRAAVGAWVLQLGQAIVPPAVNEVSQRAFVGAAQENMDGEEGR